MANGRSNEQEIHDLKILVDALVKKVDKLSEYIGYDIDGIRNVENKQATSISKNEADIYYIAMEADIDLDKKEDSE